jgi:UDP-glucose-4-epimerase GalE
MTLLLFLQSSKAFPVHSVDDLSRGSRHNVDTLSALSRDGWSYHFHHHDCGDTDELSTIMQAANIELVIHFAGYAYASESVLSPLLYFDNIVTKTLGLLLAMAKAGVTALVYSSSSATYGQPLDDQASVAITESTAQVPVSPYGSAKLMAEQIIDAYASSLDKQVPAREFSFAVLRYFNVIGADEQMRIGPLPQRGLKRFRRVVDACFDAIQNRTEMSIYGSDYSTPDGTAIRDYIHVWDVVTAHLAVMSAVRSNQRLVYNVSIGRGISINELVAACEHATGQSMKVIYRPRRQGDPGVVVGDASKIMNELGWKAKYTDATEMIRTAWAWRKAADGEG